MFKIPENVQLVAKAVLPLVVISILFFVLGQLAFAKVSEARNQISSARKDFSVLTEKLELLRSVSINGKRDANFATNALPDTVPSLLVVSQLRTLANANGLIITSVKQSLGLSGSADVNSVVITVTVQGEKSQLDNFLAGVGTFAPITYLDNVKIVQSAQSFNGEISVKSFWSQLPTKLPDSIEGYNDLTSDEKETLVKVSNLTQPGFTELLPANSEGKPNPFLK